MCYNESVTGSKRNGGQEMNSNAIIPVACHFLAATFDFTIN